MKKKIFIASHNMEIGGAERALLSLLNSFDYDKYDVDLFLMQHNGPFFKFIPNNVNILPEVKQYSCLAVPFLSVLKKRQFKIALGRLFGKLKANKYKKENNINSDNCVELIYSHKYTKSFMPTISDKQYDFAISFLTPHYFVAEKIKATKKVAWIHTDYSFVKTDVITELKMWEVYNHIISISDDCTNGFVSIFPELKNKIVHIENILSSDFIKQQANENIDSNDFTKNNDESLLLSVGRFCNPKNFDNVPEICTFILHSGLKIKWYIIGFGNDEQLIKDNIKKFNVEKNVIILGKKENPYPYMKKCDVYIQPSRYEGKAVTVQEAQCLGKPVIITDYPTANSQLKDGVDGVIVPLDNKNCAKKIVEILNDKNLLNIVSANTNKRDYSNASEIFKLYELINS